MPGLLSALANDPARLSLGSQMGRAVLMIARFPGGDCLGTGGLESSSVPLLRRVEGQGPALAPGWWIAGCSLEGLVLRQRNTSSAGCRGQ